MAILQIRHMFARIIADDTNATEKQSRETRIPRAMNGNRDAKINRIFKLFAVATTDLIGC